MSNADDGLKGLKEKTPILGAVAYPPHLLYVPPQLWAVNVVLASTVGFWAGVPSGDGIRVDVTLGAAMVLHLFFLMRFRRDRHVWKVWMAKYWRSSSLPARSRTANLLRRRLRRANRFC